ncbi:F0F1 ATP synthase subunit A [Butyrivibrio sp. MC2013]|uniref:F0F1 ATP synthase subunit A n=1 Tax=Butyrivibrio sp. MC2013 TaxID=1280686 RepID=UPI0004789212
MAGAIKDLFTELLGEDKTAIEIPFGNGFFNINQSVVNSWIIMAVLLVISIFLTHNLKVFNISKRQAVTEFIVLSLRNLIGGIIGPGGMRYTDIVIVILLYIGASNVYGLFGGLPPTMDLNVTIGLAVLAIIIVEYSAIHKKKLGGWFKSFAQPVAIIAPMNVLELGIRPLSLCMRLFGNVLGATIIMELLKMLVPLGVPAIFSIYFDLFDGLLQAYVFVFLTSLYINESTE